ncbi:DUF983 domain-containing protein [Oricola sp.]|uniref:DUF983 domain-containing protein n=1 Tax=Oricola sp. TaxID=1979950 RepID=UPI0026011C42|nr:DUF983 domain-containing protein [Oricola sp.]MCI5073525.1 DUF983 domain-containing protein [Oricola sp.]
MTDDQYPPLPPMTTGPAGKCPHCGEGSIFNGFITLKERCDVCGLDLSFADAADGPAFFVMLIASVPVLGFALWMTLSVGAAYWLTALLTLPLLVLFCVLPLRPIKGWLVSSQYFHKAEQGRLDHEH